MSLPQYGGGAGAGSGGGMAANDGTAHTGSNNNIRQDLQNKQLQGDAGSSRIQMAGSNEQYQPSN